MVVFRLHGSSWRDGRAWRLQLRAAGLIFIIAHAPLHLFRRADTEQPQTIGDALRDGCAEGEAGVPERCVIHQDASRVVVGVESGGQIPEVKGNLVGFAVTGRGGDDFRETPEDVGERPFARVLQGFQVDVPRGGGGG